MPGFSSIDLWDIATKDAHATRFFKLALLMEAVEAGGRWASGVDLQLIVPVIAKLPYARLFNCPRAFFWRTLDTHLRQSASEKEAVAAERALAIQMLDAFFAVLPNGLELSLNAPEGEHLFFPELGVQVAAGMGQAIGKQSDGLVLIRPDEGGIVIDVASPGPRFRLNKIPISARGAGSILAHSGPAMFDSGYGGGIIFDLPEDRGLRLAETIRDAYGFLDRLDSRIAQRLLDNVTWYVPVRSPRADVHVSFSVPRLSGVIFLSEPASALGVPGWLKLAEVLVHEFAHNELSLYQESHKLFHEDPTDGFCSPWRPDPRPLNGIVHGMYAFWHVAEFFRCAEAAVEGQYADQLRNTRRRLLSQLWFAHMQVPRERLLDRGADMLDLIARHVEEQISTLGEAASNLESQVAAHIAEWKTKNPDYSGRIKFR
jgi:HEXXH motif-containing protein